MWEGRRTARVISRTPLQSATPVRAFLRGPPSPSEPTEPSPSTFIRGSTPPPPPIYIGRVPAAAELGCPDRRPGGGRAPRSACKPDAIISGRPRAARGSAPGRVVDARRPASISINCRRRVAPPTTTAATSKRQRSPPRAAVPTPGRPSVSLVAGVGGITSCTVASTRNRPATRVDREPA